MNGDPASPPQQTQQPQPPEVANETEVAQEEAVQSYLDQPFYVSLVFFRFLGGFGAGLVGTVVWGLILFLTWSIVGDVLSPSDVQTTEFGIQLGTDKMHPLFIYIVIFAVFIATLAANLAYILIASIVEEKYYSRSTALTHVFFGELVCLFFFLPAYIMGSKIYGTFGVAAAALLHTLCVGIFTYFVLEIIAAKKHMLVNVYGVILGIVLFFFLGTLFSKGSATVSSFLALPFMLGMLGTGNGIAEGIYHWFYHTYYNDFLNSDKRFGEEYGKEEEEQDEVDEEL